MGASIDVNAGSMSVAAAPATTMPITVGAWVNKDIATAGNRSVFTINDGTTSNEFHGVIRVQSVQIRLYTNGNIDVTNQSIAAGWQFVSWHWVSATERYVINHGTKSDTFTSSITPSGVNAFDVGNSLWDGYQGPIAVWDKELSQAEHDQAVAGAPLNMIASANCQGYWRMLYGTSNEPDLVGGNTLVKSGVNDASEGPPVWYRTTNSVVIAPVAAGGAATASLIRGGNLVGGGLLLRPGGLVG